MKRNPEFCQTNQIRNVLGRLCLILSLWQGPIPWLHCHDEDVTELSSPVSASNLRLHLASFHGNSQDKLGWHCHWILPCWNHCSDENCQQDQSSRESVSLDTIASQTTAASLLEGFGMAAFVCHRFIHHIEVNDGHVKRPFAMGRPPMRREMSAVLRC